MSDTGEGTSDEGDADLEDEDEYVDEGEEPPGAGAASGAGGAAKAPRAQRPKKVPRGTLQSAVALTTTMWGTAGSGSESADAIARLFGHETTNSGSFRNKLALMRIWGLVEGGDSLKLTDIGLDIIRDDDPPRQLTARRTAFYKPKAFKKLVEAYDGRELPPEDALATKCRFDFNLAPSTALEVARVLAASLPYAGLMDENGVVRKDGALAAATPGADGAQPAELENDDHEDGAPSNGGGPAGPAAHSTAAATDAIRSDEEAGAGAGNGASPHGGGAVEEDAGAAGTQAVEIRVILTGYSGAEVVEILRTVGYRDAQG